MAAYIAYQTRGRISEWIVTGPQGQVGISHRSQESAEREVAYLIARDAAKTVVSNETAATPATYRTVRDGAFGEGRIYASLPGATQYDNGNGKFDVQIWDNDGEDY